MVSRRYIAGSEIQQAVEKVKQLNAAGMTATLDLLGESSQHERECQAAVDEYLRILETIERQGLDSNISVKPTQLGLHIDADLCYRNIRTLVEGARAKNNFVRIDMEDSSCTSATIEIFNRLRAEFDNVGIVIQACLRRSLDDVKRLAKMGANFRLCKGIYIESRKIAFRDPEIVNLNFALLTETAMNAGRYVGVATHDEQVVWHTFRVVEQLGIARDDFEFQMLLGVDEELRQILVDAGYRLRVYVPYGKQWYAYCKRRLKENPRIGTYVLKAMLRLS
jgi:proline dehydrogenase